jgi:ribose transport system ATP-binding protein
MITGTTPLLEVRSVSKRFPGVVALDGVSLHVGAGEVVAVLGENGAGKSTLMKILAGVQTPDGGEIVVDGTPVEIDSVQTALRYGIALIHQELNLADNLSVAANIMLGREPRRMGLIDHGQVRRLAQEAMDRVGLTCSPRTLVKRLSIGHQQMVEIAKALSTSARILIMDEPTSSLSEQEARQLFVLVKDLRQRGISVVYISHRLGEVSELADRVVVLRDGRNAGALSREQINHDAMVRLMVGRELSQFYPHEPHEPGPVALEVAGVRTRANPGHEVSFSVRGGEIVGIAGLVGAGRSELLTTIFGITPALGGTIKVGGVEVTPGSPREAIAAGIALVPEDRKQQGLVLGMAVRENMSLATVADRSRRGFVNRGYERQLAARMIEAMRIRTPSDRQIVQYLSGGNQQKVVLGKWLAAEPKVLLLDEPTRGIDVGAKQEIYRLMEDLARGGAAVAFVSSEMEEVLGMSDRALVMHEGCLAGELARDELSEESVMRLATGSGPPMETTSPS